MIYILHIIYCNKIKQYDIMVNLAIMFSNQIVKICCLRSLKKWNKDIVFSIGNILKFGNYLNIWRWPSLPHTLYKQFQNWQMLAIRSTECLLTVYQPKTACCPVYTTDDDFKILGYPFKNSLLTDKMKTSLFWHSRSKGACCPVDRHNDNFEILGYPFEKSLLTRWPTQW